LEILLLLYWFIATLGIGYSILKIIFYRSNPLFFGEALALSYGIGIAAVSIQMALMSLFGLKFGVLSIMTWWVPVIAAAVLIPPRRWDYHLRGGTGPYSGLEKFLSA
jgi:hypothetical protein